MDVMDCNVLLKRKFVMGKWVKEPEAKKDRGDLHRRSDRLQSVKIKRVITLGPTMGHMLYCVHNDE
eukprot:scaffold625_cov324-Pavlova_lutheri.AAC.55